MKSLYCDFQYVKTGHHDQDFMILNKYCDGNLEHIKFNEHNFFRNILLIMKILKRKENKTIGTVSFLCLYIASLFSRNWNYNLVIHFFPQVHCNLYKFLFSVFIKKCKNIIVFADCVKKDILLKTNSKLDSKIVEIHQRELHFLKKEQTEEEKTILCIGNLNSIKLIEPLFHILQENKFKHIHFKFICNGIQNRLKNMGFSNILNNNLTIEDRFPVLENYLSEINKATYTFLDYSEKYGSRSSAVMLDSLSQGTPVICCKNPSFSELVEKYNCGYIFHNEIELKNILSEINSGILKTPAISELLINFYSERKNKKLAQVLI